MKRVWETDELIDLFTLIKSDLEFIYKKSNDTNRLGFACLYKFFKLEARFPINQLEIPHQVILFIAKQLNITIDIFKQYDWNSRTIKRHRAEIREFFDFKEMTLQDTENLIEWLYKNNNCYKKEIVTTIALKRLRELKLEPPTSDRMDRISSSATIKYERRLFLSIKERLADETLYLIDHLIHEFAQYENYDNTDDIITFNKLRSDPGRIGLESILDEVKKLQVIRNLKIPENIFDDIPQKILKEYKQRISSELLGEIKRHPDEIRYSLLAIFFWERGREITDNLADLLISIIHKIDSKAVKKVEREIIKEIKKVHGKYNILKGIAELSIENPEGIIKDVIYPSFNKKLLQDLIQDLKMNNSAFTGKVRTVMKNSYSRHYRRMLPKLLNIIEFKSNNDIHKPVLEALKIVKENIDSSARYLQIDDTFPISGIIKSKWKSAIIQKNEHGKDVIERFNYEICVLQALRAKLRCKEVWITGADKYRNPEDDLPDDFDIKRDEYYEALKQPNDAMIFIEKLKNEMDDALQRLNNNIPKNPKVKITTFKGGRISVTPSDPQNEPLNLSILKSELMRKWPMINLLDILKETDYYTSFTDNFKSTAVRETLDRENIQRRLLITLYGLGTNTGLKRIAKASNSSETFDDLLAC